MRRIGHLALVLAAAASLAGCRSAAPFPDGPSRQRLNDDGSRLLEYDTNGDGRADYFEHADPAGRIVRLDYDEDADGRIDQSADLSAIDRGRVPHFVIMLDGIPFSLVDAMWREGRFRLFPPPSRSVACFPSMTDLAFNDILHAGRSPGYEARAFDRSANRFFGGTSDYLSADNSQWMARLDYHISLLRHSEAYTNPRKLFADELAGMAKTFDAADGPRTVLAYSVATAGVGTRYGEPGLRDCLDRVDRLCEQIVCRRRGRVSLTVLADHGHNLAAGPRVSFKRYLEDRGWHCGKSLGGDRDVVYVEYGLVTYAAFYARSPARLADDLAPHQAVDLVLYPDGDAVVVRKGEQSARITQADLSAANPGVPGFRYDATVGDPLGILPIIEKLREQGRVTAAGVVDSKAFAAATVDHEYPDPLARIWRGFHDVVDHPADLIVSLKDPWYHGSPFFDFMVTEASTHGSLNRANSETFVLSTRAALPAVINQPAILPALGVKLPPPPREKP